MSDGDAGIEGSHGRPEHGGGIALDEDGGGLRFGEPGGDAGEHARRQFGQRLTGRHEAQIDVGLQSERTQGLIEEFTMLPGGDEQRLHLARTPQFGEHRRELDALGARADDEGEGGHLCGRIRGLSR